jgi:hypothetical protein
MTDDVTLYGPDELRAMMTGGDYGLELLASVFDWQAEATSVLRKVAALGAPPDLRQEIDGLLRGELGDPS